MGICVGKPPDGDDVIAPEAPQQSSGQNNKPVENVDDADEAVTEEKEAGQKEQIAAPADEEQKQHTEKAESTEANADDDEAYAFPPVINTRNGADVDLTANAELAKTPEANLKRPTSPAFDVNKSPSFVYNEQMAGELAILLQEGEEEIYRRYETPAQPATGVHPSPVDTAANDGSPVASPPVTVTITTDDHATESPTEGTRGRTDSDKSNNSNHSDSKTRLSISLSTASAQNRDAVIEAMFDMHQKRKASIKALNLTPNPDTIPTEGSPQLPTHTEEAENSHTELNEPTLLPTVSSLSLDLGLTDRSQLDMDDISQIAVASALHSAKEAGQVSPGAIEEQAIALALQKVCDNAGMMSPRESQRPSFKGEREEEGNQPETEDIEEAAIERALNSAIKAATHPGGDETLASPSE